MNMDERVDQPVTCIDIHRVLETYYTATGVVRHTATSRLSRVNQYRRSIRLDNPMLFL